MGGKGGKEDSFGASREGRAEVWGMVSKSALSMAGIGSAELEDPRCEATQEGIRGARRLGGHQ